MKYAIAFMSLVISFSAQAETLFQCAVDQVAPNGARVNVIEKDGTLKANLIFGTTVSGTMYQLVKTELGYAGSIKGNAHYKMELKISSEEAENKNIRGVKAQLRAVYPSMKSPTGISVINTEVVCGEKVSNRWE